MSHPSIPSGSKIVVRGIADGWLAIARCSRLHDKCSQTIGVVRIRDDCYSNQESARAVPHGRDVTLG